MVNHLTHQTEHNIKERQMIQKITIQGINRKDYSGVDKRGAPYRAQIVGVYDGSRWYSYFDRYGKSLNWQVGDTMEFEVTTKTDKTGKLRYDIDLLSPEAALTARIEKLERFAVKAVNILDQAFGTGWREDVYKEPPREQPTMSRAPINVDQIAQELENMEVAKAVIKPTVEEYDAPGSTGTIWN